MTRRVFLTAAGVSWFTLAVGRGPRRRKGFGYDFGANFGTKKGRGI